jgi:uncharacterized protein (DUF58 family)
MRRADLVLSLSAVALSAAYLLGNPALGLVGALILAHYSMARLSFSPRLDIERELPERASEGEPVKARLRVRNLSTIPGVVTVRETAERIISRPLRLRIGASEEKFAEHTLVPLVKGKLSLKAEVVFEDQLGLFARRFPVKDTGEMTVFPSPKSIRQAMAEKKQVEALAEAEQALGLGSETLEFEELREFLPGDDITKIDWKATSRLQKLIVRVFKRESMADVYFLVNVDKRFRRELKPGRVNYLVLLLAQLATYFKRFGHGIRGVAYDERSVVKSVGGDPLKLLEGLELRGEFGIPALKPSEIGSLSRLRRLLSRSRKGTPGIVRASLRVPAGSYVIIVDDPGLHPGDILTAVRLLERKGSKVALIYPNPIYFLPKDSLTEENLEALYRAYKERKELLKRVRARLKVVEVSPRDLLPEVVRKL